MKAGKGKRLALLAAVLALAVLGMLAAVVATGRFTLRYDVGDLLEKWQEPHEGATFTLEAVIVTYSPEEARFILRVVLEDSLGGEERLGACALQIEGDILTARLTIPHHWDLWRVLRDPPLP